MELMPSFFNLGIGIEETLLIPDIFLFSVYSLGLFQSWQLTNIQNISLLLQEVLKCFTDFSSQTVTNFSVLQNFIQGTVLHLRQPFWALLCLFALSVGMLLHLLMYINIVSMCVEFNFHYLKSQLDTWNSARRYLYTWHLKIKTVRSLFKWLVDSAHVEFSNLFNCNDCSVCRLSHFLYLKVTSLINPCLSFWLLSYRLNFLLLPGWEIYSESLADARYALFLYKSFNFS
jgi:hypothetical protein